MGGGAVLKFRDLFNDSSLFWAWRQYLGLTPAGKSGSESLGRYHLTINSGINGKWDNTGSEAPRIFLGVLNFPCEIITRLDTYTAIEDTYAELFIAHDPVGFGSDLYFSIGRYPAGLLVTNTSANLTSIVMATLPVWLRIRVGCGSYRGLNVYFDYSVDGRTWINLWVENTSITFFSMNPPAVGIMVRNRSALYNEVTGTFDHFIMKPKSIN